ncbi:ATP-dependent metallopeptidase FtsH/Yme1/Tma family protein [Treponema zioleckii]|uniref:ATP-dependent metallopeptidase FtsH/Yme1/Tma family protein n=1 Tax=Treponema zioleckii TaxID=331680 RepID=UPI00168BF378|nr:ATP-dependent metallopeptidase FtsH/Yme1/Tma family protein [Treponema zioleckii]
MKVRKIVFFSLILCAGAFIFFNFFYDSNLQESTYSYREFYEMVRENKIESAVLTDDKIEFTLRESQSPGEKFFVENPASPTLNEYLLLHDVKVSVEKSIDQIISLILDSIFYLIFFGTIFFVFKKIYFSEHVQSRSKNWRKI